MWLERSKHYYQRLADRFRGAPILDVGCGARRFPGAVGIDIRSRNPGDILHDLDQLPWPFRDDAFGLVVIRHCLEHLKDVVAAVEELYRIARPQGTIVVEVPHFSWCEAYTHPGHRHFFSGGSLDYFHPANEHYRAKLRIVRRRIYFNDSSRGSGSRRWRIASAASTSGTSLLSCRPGRSSGNWKFGKVVAEADRISWYAASGWVTDTASRRPASSTVSPTWPWRMPARGRKPLDLSGPDA